MPKFLSACVFLDINWTFIMVAIFEDFTTQVNYEAANLGLQDLYKNLSMVCCMQKKLIDNS